MDMETMETIKNAAESSSSSSLATSSKPQTTEKSSNQNNELILIQSEDNPEYFHPACSLQWTAYVQPSELETLVRHYDLQYALPPLLPPADSISYEEQELVRGLDGLISYPTALTWTDASGLHYVNTIVQPVYSPTVFTPLQLQGDCPEDQPLLHPESATSATFSERWMSGANGGGFSSRSLKRKRRRVITVDQRKAANVRERRRMSHLNEAFDHLRKRVPTFAYEKKLSRIETLKLAVAYIKFMAELLEQTERQQVTSQTFETASPIHLEPIEEIARGTFKSGGAKNR